MKKKYEETVVVNNTLTKRNEELKSQNDVMARQVFKMDANNDLINLDPYEMHRKIRFYQSQLDQQ
jgi:hypothetical protein